MKIFLRNKSKEVRILWVILSLTALIIAAEILIVDPFGRILSALGFEQVSGVLPKNWYETFGDSFKRITRSILVVLSVLFTIRYLVKRDRTYIGLYFNKKALVLILIGIAFGFLIQLTSVGLMSIFGMYKITGFSWQFNSLSFILSAIIYSIVFCLETGVIEEIIFRGFFLNIFAKRYSVTLGVIISSCLFGILHFSGFSEDFARWMSIISSLTVGLMLAQAYYLFGNIWLPFGIHFAWHMAARSFGSVGLNSDEAIFLVTKVEGHNLLVSTKAGGAGLFEIVGVLIIVCIMFCIKIVTNTDHRKYTTNINRLP